MLKILKKLKNIDIYVGTICLIVMVVLLIINVVLRYFFKMGISWAEEIILILFAWSTYLGVVSAFRYDLHVKVEFLFNIFPKSIQKILDMLISFGILVLGGFVTYLSLILCLNVGNKRTLVLRMPANVVNASLVVSFGLLTIWAIIRLVQKIKGTYVKEDPYEGLNAACEEITLKEGDSIDGD